MRSISARYEDPLDRIWIRCAEAVGFRIMRTPDVYASYDGLGTILIGTDETMDADDCLAQMIFHELCHALVQGDEGEQRQDWGLDNTTDRDQWREHACLRLQAYLAGQYGLRDFFAPTTDFRETFWHTLAPDAFWAEPALGGRREPSSVLARIAARRAECPRWRPYLASALQGTADIAASLAKTLGELGTQQRTGESAPDLGDRPRLPSLWESAVPQPTIHPAGHAVLAEYLGNRSCGDCAWSFRWRGKLRCRHVPKAQLPDDAPACQRWESAAELDCMTCGACCREAYDAVELDPDERVIRRHPNLIEQRGDRQNLRRSGQRCAALLGGNDANETFRCAVYPDRPRTCRDFARGQEHCLDARQRVGLSL